jgi:phosphoenolpyruvate carboxykinase (GTP)
MTSPQTQTLPHSEPAHHDAPTDHRALLDWVAQTAALTRPDRIVWVDGTPPEGEALNRRLVEAGTFVRLEGKPDSFHCVSDPDDVARVEDRTFICSESERDAGPTNHWMAPQRMRRLLTDLYRGAMQGRTLYVIPFVMGRLDADRPAFGVQLTDSPYVVACMRIMATVGTGVLERLGPDGEFVRCLHSVGAPLAPGTPDVPWPCNPTKYISHFPQSREIWSFGSGYGGNALLGKKCYALRIASAIGRDEGWLAEHMLVLKLVGPRGRVHYVAAAFPSACGKTNLAMISPTIPGWTAEMIGDDIAWIRIGPDGRLYAQNPEAGLFGVAPGTGWRTNPNAMRAIAAGQSVFTNVARTGTGDVWWEGMTEQPPADLTDWRGNPWTPADGSLSSHPNSRFCTPIENVPVLAAEYHHPAGVPLSAIIFGGRRASTVPLVVEAHHWAHGVFLGAITSSETTAAATGAVGVVRRDPMAMRPFIGYHVGDYLRHWIGIGRRAGARPRIFMVNWFRRGADGEFLWPGYGDNSRVLDWMIRRIEGTADAVDTPIGRVPAPGELNLDGLAADPRAVAEALAVRPQEWAAEVPLIEDWFATIGSRLPVQLRDELVELKDRLGAG